MSTSGILVKTSPWYLQSKRPYAIIALACILLFGVSASFSFSPLDEFWLITKEKEMLSSFSNIPKIFSEASTLGMYYRPMLTLTFMIDMVLGDGSKGAFHLDNILLHVGTMLLLFYFLQQISLSRSVSFFATLIFAVHPLHMHAVAWVPGRNDMLLASFVMLSCIFLLRYLREGKKLHAGLHILFFVLSLLTKESAVLLPGIYALFWWRYRGEKPNVTLPLFTVAWLTGVIWFLYIRSRVVWFVPAVEDAGGMERASDLFSTFAVYTGKIFLPVQQSVMPLLSSTSVWLFSSVVAIVTGIFIWRGVHDRKTALLGLSWYLVLVAIPVWLGMANGDGECYEHRTYAPAIGLLIVVTQLKLNVTPRTAKIIAIGIMLVFFVKAATRLPVYENAYAYVLAGVDEAPMSDEFHDLLGQEFERRGRYMEALTEYNRAVELDARNPDYFAHRGHMYLMLGDNALALADAQEAIRMDRSLLPVFLDRSKAYFGLGEFEKARADFDTSCWFGVPVSKGYSDSLYTALGQMR